VTPKLRESDIEKACSDILQVDGWRMLKTDPVSRREWGKGFGEKGMADCLYIRYRPERYTEYHAGQVEVNDNPWKPLAPCQSQVIWIEWKRPRGVLSPKQKLWHEAERKRGALTLIAGQDFPATFDGFLDWYRNSGLMRRAL
jgi:hypothetical protein